MGRPHFPIWLMALAALTVLATCCPEPPCPDQDQATADPVADPGPVYVGRGDPYSPGPLTVRTIQLERCAYGAPKFLQIHAPAEPGTYAVVLFQHGFLIPNAYYSEVLRHLASHGFVVVAPQMYPADGIPVFKPTTLDEANEVLAVLDWLGGNLYPAIGLTVDINRVGIAGHSRGGKVAWRVVQMAAGRFQALAGIDPTDGTLDGSLRITDPPLPTALPTLIIGAGQGDVPFLPWGLSCSPAGDNHEQFYAASPSPSWHVIVPDAGHLDVLDDQRPGCGLVCDICTTGQNPAAFRKLTAGLISALFRGALQGDSAAFKFLNDTSNAPADPFLESK
jgi:chlorophyllase